MALTTSIITGRVPLPTDENLQFAELTFALSGTDTEGADVLPGGISKRVTLIDSELPAGFDLWQNFAGLRGTHYIVNARWQVKDRDGTRDKYADLGIVQVGAAPSYTLASLINTSVPAAIGTFWSAITQAEYNAAIQAAIDADQSAQDAADSAAAAATFDPALYVLAPASAVSDRIAVFDGTTGKLLKDSGKLTTDFATAAQGAKADALSGRNLIINGSGRINQRGYVSGTATSGSNQFTLDRWFVITSGQNLTFTGTEAGRVMTAPAGGVAQVIEGANIVGGTYVINWTGTATCTVDGTARAKGGTFTLTANTNATVKFTSGTFSEIQLELGTIPTAFESINFQQDTTNCEWYYYPIKLRCRFRANGAGEVGANGYTFPRMRAAPTAVFLSNDATVNVASVSISSISSSSLTFELITTAAGDTYRIDDYGLSAELTA